MRGLITGVILSALTGSYVFAATLSVAGAETALQLADNGKPRRLTTKGAPPPAAVEPAAGGPAAADPNAIRAILDMPELAWQDLSPTEATALRKLDWSKRSWNERTSARWPRSMTTKFLNLTAVQKASVRQLGFRPLEWDLRVRKRMLSRE